MSDSADPASPAKSTGNAPAKSASSAASLAQPYVYRGEGSGAWQRFVWAMGRILFRLLGLVLFQVRVRGTENIPATGGALLATNHQSFLDPWMMAMPLGRQVHFMARDSLFKGGFLQYAIELTNAFPVKRGRADLGAVRMAIERIEKGYLVNVFPEATRTVDGTINPVAGGIALIVNRAKCPIIPVVIDGAFEAWPRDRKIPGPHPIRIIYGPLIPYETLKSMSADEMALHVRREFVRLQEKLGSPHAAASRAKLEAKA